MTFLELVQRLMSECKASGTLSTVVGQSGENLTYVNWINQAWMDIQNWRRDWLWMRSTTFQSGGMSFVTVAGQAIYELGSGAGTCGVTSANFGDWLQDTFRCYTTTQGNTGDEMLIGWLSFDDWRNAYMLGPQRSVQTRPVIMAIAPNKAICIGPPSNGNYTITGDYERRPTLMTVADASEPTGLDSQYQMAIVWKAMVDYGYANVAQEVIDRGQRRFNTVMRQLERLQLPKVTWGGPLA